MGTVLRAALGERSARRWRSSKDITVERWAKEAFPPSSCLPSKHAHSTLSAPPHHTSTPHTPAHTHSMLPTCLCMHARRQLGVRAIDWGVLLTRVPHASKPAVAALRSSYENAKAKYVCVLTCTCFY